jgi:hypothetical protein
MTLPLLPSDISNLIIEFKEQLEHVDKMRQIIEPIKTNKLSFRTCNWMPTHNLFFMKIAYFSKYKVYNTTLSGDWNPDINNIIHNEIDEDSEIQYLEQNGIFYLIQVYS